MGEIQEESRAGASDSAGLCFDMLGAIRSVSISTKCYMLMD